MIYRANKRSLSLHQKQMRFFTGMSLVAISLFTVFIFWLMNRVGP
ncbi:MAG TPA: hypothetical protein VK815_10155 [Candidatus Acidoferrales bacterium]|jgi:hypothetical protein|nr:hypothetical protein [Candidatus Acidoferrales bacterium]